MNWGDSSHNVQNPCILVTGSEGLIGKALVRDLKAVNFKVRRYDIKFPRDHHDYGNICDQTSLSKAIEGCYGVVHLAAVSRVIFGERNPTLCMETNFIGTRNVLKACEESPLQPWLLFSSSREVYGEQEILPVSPSADYRPVNIYAESKVKAEKAILSARRERGVPIAIVRYSNVYGSVDDYVDRVVPAFCRAAAFNIPLKIEGFNHTFDFTHLDDTIRGTLAVINQLMRHNVSLPPLHFTTGIPTTLEELAKLALKCGGRSQKNNLIKEPPRRFDVARFYGDTSLIFSLLGWKAKIKIEEGVLRLVSELKNSLLYDGENSENLKSNSRLSSAI